jgi:hypothetical protein
MPPAVMERPLAPLWIPPELAKTKPSPPTTGAELRLEVQKRLAETAPKKPE